MKSLSTKLVVKKSALSLEKFLKDHYLSGCPVIISDCMAHWPAKMKWNDEDYLLRVAGDRTVPVEVICLIDRYFYDCKGRKARDEGFEIGCLFDFLPSTEKRLMAG